MRQPNVTDVEKEFLEPGYNYFVQVGFENATLRNLCEVAKISVSSIYYWFENKEDLYVNIAEFGFKKVMNELYENLFGKGYYGDGFFSKLFDEVQRLKLELRLIVQVTSSPVYGNKMREKMEKYKPLFDSCAEKMSQEYRLTFDEALSFVFFLRAIISNYVVFDNYEFFKNEMEFLYKRLIAK